MNTSSHIDEMAEKLEFGKMMIEKRMRVNQSLASFAVEYGKTEGYVEASYSFALAQLGITNTINSRNSGTLPLQKLAYLTPYWGKYDPIHIVSEPEWMNNLSREQLLGIYATN